MLPDQSLRAIAPAITVEYLQRILPGSGAITSSLPVAVAVADLAAFAAGPFLAELVD